MLIALALLMFAAAAGLVGVAAVEGGDAVPLDILGVDIETTVSGVFVAGVVAALLVLAGAAALAAGIRRMRAKRKEIKSLRQQVAVHDGSMPGSASDADASVASDAESDTPGHRADAAAFRSDRPDRETIGGR